MIIVNVSIERPGGRIGRYKLLEQIGEGSCGIIFAAEQDEPVRRRVALKLVKPGMDTKSVIARLEAERQALALMDHTNIAHFFDAGATESGRPYFVMELVEGVKITDYCERHSLPTSARLDLFVQVCDAIQHAHQKGIIHCDIKPSNILVTTGPDGKPVPKVIDFGIAKAIGGQLLTDTTIFTASEMLIGTPAYISPEQAALANTDLDTRTDIYSLGVLLYELLTGTTPFDTHELLKAGFDEVRRVISEEEPVRPSTRLSTLIDSDSENLSRWQGAEAPKLIREMRGDLDWIVMKALEKDRTRRYATANGLAIDIQRYLSCQAVEARPPSASYKFRKFYLRHKLAFISMGSLFLLLAVALTAAARLLALQRRALHLADALRTESEASGYAFVDDAKEAGAALEKSLAIRKQYLDNAPLAPSTIKMIVDCLVDDCRLNDAKELMHRIVTPSLLARPEYTDHAALFPTYDSPIDLCGYVTQIFAARGDWETALPYATLMVKLKPNDSDGYRTLAPLLVATTNLAAYRVLCSKIVTTFRNTTDIYVADRMAKVCLILPSSGVDLKAVSPLADLAVTRGKRDRSYTWFRCCKALAEYRQEHFAQAIEWAASITQDLPYAKADAYAILAMAQNKLGVTNAAEQALSNCNQVIHDKLPQLGGYIGQDWSDWIIARALQSEAKRTVAERVPTVEPHDLHVSEALNWEAEARNYAADGKANEAEAAFQKSLAIRKQHLDNEPPGPYTITTIVDCLVNHARPNDAAELLNRILTPSLLARPESADLRAYSANFFASLRKWQVAATYAGLMVKLSPNDSDSYHMLAPLLIATTNLAAYHELCMKMITTFSNTTDMLVADRTAKVCLILPSSGVDLKAVSALADLAVTRGKALNISPNAYSWFRCCKALAEYRQEHFGQAIEWAASITKDGPAYAKADAYAILSMAQYKLGMTNAAQQALANCNQAIQDKLPQPGAYLSQDSSDWIIAQTLQAEAKQMIDGGASSAAQPTNLPR